MRLDQVDLRELLEADPEGGVLRFSGQRAVLLDAVALGLLRRDLVECLGTGAARDLLFRFGWAHGWRTAEGLREQFPLESEADWRGAGARLHALQGLVGVERMEAPPAPEPFPHAVWRDSFEAEQHRLYLGPSTEPVCWTLVGFASGYLSCAHGREILCREVACAGAGAEACRVVGRTREEWEALRQGLDLPLPDARGLRLALAAARQVPWAGASGRARRAGVDEAGAPFGLVARSAGMKRVIELALRVAAVESTVLVTGESGVGKEQVARLVHRASPRASRPFVTVSCGAIPEPLVEAELFGHARGAFTGAVRDREGLFEAAAGGTLFLDEVGELPLSIQPKLLRVLEERKVRRVGESQVRAVDVRLAAATHRDLAREASAGRFRRDLLYRLKVLEIAIPPLRDRPEDILPLARAALEEASLRLRRPLDGLTPRAADQLARHPWPGNIRELWNAMERAVLIANGRRVDLGDLPEEVRQALGSAVGGPRSLARLEKEQVLAALRQNRGHRGRTARELGIGVATLYRRLRAWRVRA